MLRALRRTLLYACLALLSACGHDEETDALDDGEPVTQADADAANADAARGTLDAGSSSDAAREASGAASSDASAFDASQAAGQARDAALDASARDASDATAGDANSSDANSSDARADAGSDASSDAARPDAGNGDCPAHGAVSYMLQEKAMPSSAEAAAYMKIRAAMDKAIEKYNCYTSLSRMVRVSYDPDVPTADGNVNGNMRFGSDASMHFVTAMHELGHVFGVGANEFKARVQNGVFNGPLATAEMRRISADPQATVKSDGTHFWPYGLNYVSEYKSEQDLIGHCAVVVAIRKDLGL